MVQAEDHTGSLVGVSWKRIAVAVVIGLLGVTVLSAAPDLLRRHLGHSGADTCRIRLGRSTDTLAAAKRTVSQRK